MDTNRLGHSGLRVPALSFGTGTFGGGNDFFKAWGSTDSAGASRLIDVCLDHGVSMFDTADVYSAGLAEQILGEAIKGKRNRLLISTKATFPMGDGPNDYGSSRQHILAAVEGSLKRLGVETIDLLQLHGQDYNTPVEETLSTLDQLVRAGKIRYIGCSNFSGWHLMKSLAASDRYGYPRYVAHQAYYSLLNRDYEWELMQLGRDQGVGAVVWSPLGWGKLTGKIRRGQPAQPGTRAHTIPETGPRYDEKRLFAIVDALDALAKETGKTIPQIALNWLAASSDRRQRHHRRAQRRAVAREHRRRRLETDARAGGEARRGERRRARLSGLAPARLSAAQRESAAELKAGQAHERAASCGSALASETVAVVIGLQELSHAWLRAFVEHAARRPIFNDAAFVDEGDAARDMGGEAHLMGDDQHRHALAPRGSSSPPRLRRPARDRAPRLARRTA